MNIEPTYNQYAESLQQIAEILGAPFSPSREIVLRAKELRADIARVTAERDELKKSRDAAAWANQQLTLVLINAGAPEFSSAAHALEWATETATLRARVSELGSTLENARSELETSVSGEMWRAGRRDYEWEKERAEQAEQRNAELVASLRDAAAGLRNCMGMLDELEGLDWGEDGMPFTIDWDYLKPLIARADSATPAKAQCQFCGSELLWSEDRGAHCDGCGAEPDLDTPAPRADTVRMDWLFANTIIAAPDGHVIDCREDLDAAMKGGAHD